MSAQDAKANKALSSLFSNIGDKTTKHEEQLITTSHNLMPHLIVPLVTQLGITETSGPVAFLDNACGSGVLTQEVQKVMSKDAVQKSSFLCADNAEGMVSLVRKRVDMEGWVNVEAKTLNAMDTGLPDNSFSHVGIALGLHLIPNPDAVLTGDITDVKRVLRPNGIFTGTTFHKDNTFWIPDVRSAFSSFPFPAPLPDKVRMQMHDSGNWTDRDWIETHLKEEGFTDVKATLSPGMYHIKSAEEFIDTFGIMLSWLMNSYWDEETRRAHPVDEVKGLLSEHLEEKYQGKGWDINWLTICFSGRVDKERRSEL